MGKYFRIKRSQAGDIHMKKMLVLQFEVQKVQQKKKERKKSQVRAGGV